MSRTTYHNGWHFIILWQAIGSGCRARGWWVSACRRGGPSGKKRTPPAWWPRGYVEEGVVAGCEEGCRLPPDKARPLPTVALPAQITCIKPYFRMLTGLFLLNYLTGTIRKPTCGYKKPASGYKLVGTRLALVEASFGKVLTKRMVRVNFFQSSARHITC